MSQVVTAPYAANTFNCIQQTKSHQPRGAIRHLSSVVLKIPSQFCLSNPNLKSVGCSDQKGPKRNGFKCYSSGTNPGSGDNESKTVLDAFFLGKALAEVINERVESTVGEFLSTIGRLQAEQQKQVQEIQEEVFERAKVAKEKAAREAMEAQGVIPPKIAVVHSTSSVNGVTSSTTITVTPPTMADNSEPIIRIDTDETSEDNADDTE